MCVDKTDLQYLKEAVPCPFCGGVNLTTTWWAGDDGEFTAIACMSCKAEAPAAVWNNRADTELFDFVKTFKDNLSELPAFLKQG